MTNTIDIHARAGSVLNFGNGSWDITVGGSYIWVTVGNGPLDLFDAYGHGTFTIGNGTHHLVLTGSGDVIDVGTGHTTLEVAGPYDQITVAGGTLTLPNAGWASQITMGPGTSIIGLSTLDRLTVSAQRLGSAISESGVLDKVTLKHSANERISLGLGGEITTLVGDAAGNYRGIVDLTGLAENVVVLQALRGLSSFADVQAHLHSVAGGSVLALPGGGDIIFQGAHPTAANFGFAS